MNKFDATFKSINKIISEDIESYSQYYIDLDIENIISKGFTNKDDKVDVIGDMEQNAEFFEVEVTPLETNDNSFRLSSESKQKLLGLLNIFINEDSIDEVATFIKNENEEMDQQEQE